MYSIPVDAILRSFEGEVLEYGKAFILPDEDFIDFKNEFVPLLSLGQPVTICLMLDGEETIRFDGHTYISSATMLRLTRLDSKLLMEAREMFSSNLSVHTILNFCKNGRWRIKKTEGSIAATIYRISPDTLRFISLEPVGIGQDLLVSFTTPFNFVDVIVRVEALARFGLMAMGYRCCIISMPDDAVQGMSRYLSPLRQELLRMESYRSNPDEDEEGET